MQMELITRRSQMVVTGENTSKATFAQTKEKAQKSMVDVSAANTLIR
jgi:sarcosine oxidase gamma subunit